MRRTTENTSLEFDGIGEANGAGLQDGAIEREGAGELGDDALQNADVLHLRVGIVGGHHAAFAQLDGFDEHGTQAKRAARPGALREAGDATDNDVGPKPAAIHTEAGNGTIGGDEKRQDVESLRPREFDELRGRLFQEWPFTVGRPSASSEPCSPRSFG